MKTIFVTALLALAATAAATPTGELCVGGGARGERQRGGGHVPRRGVVRELACVFVCITNP